MKRFGILCAAAALLASGSLAVYAADNGAAGIPDHPSKLKFGDLDFKVPDASDYRHELPNGIVVYVAEDHELPLVNISMTLRVGSFLEPASKTGLASMTGQLMRSGGTESKTAEEFDEAVDFLAANIGSFSGETSSGARMNCITPVVDGCLDLYFEMLEKPRFEQSRIEVEKESRLERMKQRNDNAAGIARRSWSSLMYGTDHFTSRQMTKSDLDAITRDDLIKFHANYWRAEKVIIAVSGDVDTTAILAKLEQHMSDWTSDGPDVPWPPPAPSHTPSPGVYYYEKDIPQGRVRIGHRTIKRKNWDDPTPITLSVMNDILGGGGFTSRLTNRIRSDEGLAYSAGSRFQVGQYWPGAFGVFYQSKSETVAYAAKISLEELGKIRSEQVTDDELKIAKNSLIDSFPQRFQSPGQVAETFASDEYEGRPHEYWTKYRDRVRGVSAKDILAAAKKYLHPEELVILIVGNWEEIRKGDPDGRASLADLTDKESVKLPELDPLTLKPVP